MGEYQGVGIIEDQLGKLPTIVPYTSGFVECLLVLVCLMFPHGELRALHFDKSTFFILTTWRGWWWVETTGTAEHSIIHKTDICTKNYQVQNVNKAKVDIMLDFLAL